MSKLTVEETFKIKNDETGESIILSPSEDSAYSIEIKQQSNDGKIFSKVELSTDQFVMLINIGEKFLKQFSS